MFDRDLIEQLKPVFSVLESYITLVMAPSTHPQQAELRDMLSGIAEASSHISVAEPLTASSAHVPRFTITVNGQPSGVSFHGIPGGHEFTSLIVAILNADGKGKLPDEGIQKRIRAIRGPIRLRTYVSLECTNCPDVIQALNQMAYIHDDFQHDMCDGALMQSDVERLGIQGVPAVFVGDELVHVGKADLGGLLATLEERFGVESATTSEVSVQNFDVAVIGGGPAGAAAAIYTARKGLKVAVIAGRIGGQVADTLGIENLISTPYTEGPKLAADMRSHLTAAGVTVLEHRMVESIRDDDDKVITLKGGEVVHCEQLIITTGAKWRELGVPGEKEHIGHGVAFCPHCDGPFFKGQRVAVIGGGNSGVEAAIDLAGICSEVTLLEFGDTLRADKVLQKKLHSLDNVSVVTSARTTGVIGDGSKVSAIEWEDRPTKEMQRKELDGVFVQIGLSPNSAVVKDLVETNRAGEIVIDERGRTSRSGIYAAGDVTTVPYKQIIIAMGEGAKCALTAFEDRMRKSA